MAGPGWVGPTRAAFKQICRPLGDKRQGAGPLDLARAPQRGIKRDEIGARARNVEQPTHVSPMPQRADKAADMLPNRLFAEASTGYDPLLPSNRRKPVFRSMPVT